MKTNIIDGRHAAHTILARLKKRVVLRPHKPFLITIIVGNRPDSELYVTMKERAATSIGLRTKSVRVSARVAQKTLTATIRKLAVAHPDAGLLLQLPLPSHLETAAVIQAIPPAQDIDGLRADSSFAPPFLRAMEYCLLAGRPLKKTCLLLANPSPLRQRFVSLLQQHRFRVQTDTAHRRIPPSSKNAGAIITFRGRGPMLRPEHLSPQSVVVDGGIRTREGRVHGDVDARVYTDIRAVSPVPGGVGPLTIAFLLQNLVTKK